MADNSDFDVEAMRWAITSVLALAANTSDPPGVEKDVGWQVNGAHNSAYENNSRANAYVIARWLVEDILPEMFPWDGLLPGQSSITVTDSATSFALDVPSRRYWLGGELVTVPANAALAYTNNAGPANPRQDYVAVEVVNSVGTYIIVEGGSGGGLPSLAANQYAVATYGVAIGGAGDFPINLTTVVLQPVDTPESRVLPTLTLAMGFSSAILPEDVGSESFFVNETISGGYTLGAISLGSLERAAFPVNIPVGSTINEVRLRGLKDTTTTTDKGYSVTLRRADVTAGTYSSLATGDNDGTGLSPTPFTVTLGSVAHVTEAGYIYDVQIQGLSPNIATAGNTNPKFWSVEVDYTPPA